MSYQPRPSDIAWTLAQIARMNDGGYWGIPRERTVYRFDKTNKVLRLTHGEPGSDFAAMRVILPMIGWKLVIEQQPLTDAIILETGMGKTLGWTFESLSAAPPGTQ